MDDPIMEIARRQVEEGVFEQLVAQHGTGWVISALSARADVMDTDGAGESALLGFVLGGMTAAQLTEEGANAVLDRDHLYLVTFAATEDQLAGIIETMTTTLEALRAAGGADRGEGGEAEGDGDPGPELDEAI
jgi:hypothetical protein